MGRSGCCGNKANSVVNESLTFELGNKFNLNDRALNSIPADLSGIISSLQGSNLSGIEQLTHNNVKCFTITCEDLLFQIPLGIEGTNATVESIFVDKDDKKKKKRHHKRDVIEVISCSESESEDDCHKKPKKSQKKHQRYQDDDDDDSESEQEKVHQKIKKPHRKAKF